MKIITLVLLTGCLTTGLVACNKKSPDQSDLSSKASARWQVKLGFVGTARSTGSGIQVHDEPTTVGHLAGRQLKSRQIVTVTDTAEMEITGLVMAQIDSGWVSSEYLEEIEALQPASSPNDGSEDTGNETGDGSTSTSTSTTSSGDDAANGSAIEYVLNGRGKDPDCKLDGGREAFSAKDFGNANTPALLSTIAWGEGVGSCYHYTFRFIYVPSSEQHPNFCVRFGNGAPLDDLKVPNPPVCRNIVRNGVTIKASTAAGRFQFLTSTWNGLAKAYKYPNFDPENQDDGGYRLVRQSGLSDSGTMYTNIATFTSAMNKIKNVWASIQGSTIDIQQGQRSTADAWCHYRIFTNQVLDPNVDSACLKTLAGLSQ